ncbi:MAG: hypothetical protein U1F11_10465 [Steroidobacteraceae bacterium]
MGIFSKKIVPPAPAGVNIRISNPWHAVSIESGRAGCPAAREVSGVRFLSKDAPTLPLVGCTDPRGCRCVYRHFDDRRAGPRRHGDHGGQLHRNGPFYGGEERRVSRGRRTTDGG